MYANENLFKGHFFILVKVMGRKRTKKPIQAWKRLSRVFEIVFLEVISESPPRIIDDNNYRQLFFFFFFHCFFLSLSLSLCVCVFSCPSDLALVFGPRERHVCVPLIPLKGPSGRILGHENARSNTNVITRTNAHTRARTPALEDSDGADISLLEGPVLSTFVGKASNTLLGSWSKSVLKRD